MLCCPAPFSLHHRPVTRAARARFFRITHLEVDWTKPCMPRHETITAVAVMRPQLCVLAGYSGAIFDVAEHLNGDATRDRKSSLIPAYSPLGSWVCTALATTPSGHRSKLHVMTVSRIAAYVSRVFLSAVGVAIPLSRIAQSTWERLQRFAITMRRARRATR